MRTRIPTLFGALALLAVPGIVQAIPITHQIIFQPYQVSYVVEGPSDITAISDGSLEAFGDAVFSQVGVDISLLAPIVFMTTPEGDISDHLSRFQTEAGLPSLGTRTIVPLFIDSLFTGPGPVGLGLIGAAGIIVRSPEDRMLSVFAHLLGHNLGLIHTSPFTGLTSNLMDFGSCIGATLASVSPIITVCDFAPWEINQVTTSLSSFSFAHSVSVPEPGTLGLFTIGLFALAFMRCKRTALRSL